MKIGVVGLGISGLRTAQLLERYGCQVEMFEARLRVGGRLHTIDEGEGVVYEAGGEWIDSDHVRCLGLLEEFGLQPLSRKSWPRRVVYKGKQRNEVDIWNDALEDDLRVEAAAKELCRNLSDVPWHNEQSADLDHRTLDDFVREHTQSERGLWWVTAKLRSDEGDDLNRVGLLGWLAGWKHYLDREGDEMSAYRVPGGWRQLCETILSRLRGPAHFGKVLSRVHQDTTGVTIEFDDGGSSRVDAVVLTLPPTALERVVFEPPLSCEKRCAVEASELGRSVKLTWEFSEPWWHDHEWGGSMLCDSKIQQTWDGSIGSAHILNAYANGADAVAWQAMGDPVHPALFELAQIFPEAAKTVKRGWFHDWVGDPYCRGSFSHLAPGYVMEYMKDIAPPEGRVHFAGEHTAQMIGFIESALESAERVVPEVIQSAS